ncbi:MAG: divalent-cation tolerance protein CutA [Rhodovibrionaceae bacterium]|nr:divalent-cation tolerance protein CutA [Rhodovibrionaceae bacterium]
MSYCMVYITAGNEDEARNLGRKLVDARLAACANVIPAMVPIFRWEGEIQEDSEAVLIAKTRADLVERIVEAMREWHSYDCPCVVALPIAGGNPDFLSWIGEETGDIQAG